MTAAVNRKEQGGYSTLTVQRTGAFPLQVPTFSNILLVMLLAGLHSTEMLSVEDK